MNQRISKFAGMAKWLSGYVSAFSDMSDGYIAHDFSVDYVKKVGDVHASFKNKYGVELKEKADKSLGAYEYHEMHEAHQNEYDSYVNYRISRQDNPKLYLESVLKRWIFNDDFAFRDHYNSDLPNSRGTIGDYLISNIIHRFHAEETVLAVYDVEVNLDFIHSEQFILEYEIGYYFVKLGS
jgi:hypothetical protein